MAERRSPLCGHRHVGDFAPTTVTLTEQAPQALWQVAGWDDFEAAVAPVVAALSKDENTPTPTFGEAALLHDNLHGLRIAPDKLWLRGSDAPLLEKILTRQDSKKLAVLDLSESRCVITVQGDGATTLLARVAPLDFSIDAMPPGTFAQTGIHHIGVLIHRQSTAGAAEFDIYVPYTWAASVWEWLHENAAGL